MGMSNIGSRRERERERERGMAMAAAGGVGVFDNPNYHHHHHHHLFLHSHPPSLPLTMTNDFALSSSAASLSCTCTALRSTSTTSFSSSCSRCLSLAAETSRTSTSDEEHRVERLWQQFFSDPSQWWDKRSDKRNPRFPDFKHKTAKKKALWINNRLNPPWIHAKLAAMMQCQEQGQLDFSAPEVSVNVANTEQLWQVFFSDPSQWWDNRLIKKSPRYPDFKHKTTNEGLWIEGWVNPSWVKEKMTSVTLGQPKSDGGLRSRDSDWDAQTLSKLCWEGKLNAALHRVELMVQNNIQVPPHAYVILLKGCAKCKALDVGKQVHALVVQSGYDSEILLENTLVDMYAKCGSVVDARRVFDKMHEYNVFSWTALIAAYADHGQAEEALVLFQHMKRTGITPDKVAFVVALKACARIAALEQGKQIHSELIKSGFESDVILGNALISMYAKCMCIEDARGVFNKMNEPGVVSWNAMITGYTHQGLGKEVLSLYEQMKQENVQINVITFVVLLKACASITALEQGKKIHAQIIKNGFESDMIVCSALVDMYGKCGSVDHARQVFNQMSERDVVSWSAMIAGYAQLGRGKEALALYEQMKQEAVQPDIVTYVVLIKACASIAALEQGKDIHSEVIRRGFESHLFVGNALVDMYAKCGCIEDSHELLMKMPERDVISWTALIAGYVKHGLGNKALALYEQMKQENVQPNNITYVVLLNACASVAALDQGKQLHSDIIKGGLESDLILGNALVDMFAKCGSIGDAHEVFIKLNERDVVSWNAMISGYAQQGLQKEALILYEQMRQEGVQPDSVTYVVLLKGCATIEQGQHLHSHIFKSGFESDMIVGSTLIDMYAKFGSIDCALQVFNKMSERDVVSWTAIIAGYAQQGLGKEVFRLFEQMQREGVKPNEVTYVNVLSACSHSGLVDEGCGLFDSMHKDHGIIPNVGHYACVVDLLGRAGRLTEAEDFIKKMPIQPDALVWMTLLGAARNHGHVEIGRRAFYSVVKLEPENAAAYVLLSNIYAAAGRVDEVAQIKKEMKDAGLETKSGMRLF